MSQVLPKRDADKLAFAYQPKVLRRDLSETAEDFVAQEEKGKSDFVVSPLVEQTAGMAVLKKKKLESEIEESVLQRVKDLEEQAYQKAYELGLQEGTEKAFQEAKEDLTSRIHKLDELLAGIENLKSVLIKENETLFVKLALEIGKKIAAREIELNQEPIINLAKELVEGIRKDDKVVLRLSQKDFEFLEDLRKRNDQRVDFLENVKIVPTIAVADGGCTIETNFGAIDSTVAERTGRIWKALLARTPDLRGHKTDVKEDPDGQSES